jgi:hypothetical protein
VRATTLASGEKRMTKDTKEKERQKSKVEFIKRNRSAHLEGKAGFYDGKPITTNYIWIEDDD